jgi:hypothetical protein
VGEEGGAQHGKSVRNTTFRCWSQHARHKPTTCSPQTHNMYTMSGEEGGGATWKKCSQHGKMCSKHGKKCSQHSQHASQHHDPTASMFPDSNRVARKVSDASARFGRPGASSSVNILLHVTVPIIALLLHH